MCKCCRLHLKINLRLEVNSKSAFSFLQSHLLNWFKLPLFACRDDDTTDKCKKANEKLEMLEEDMKAKCKEDGEYCEMNVKTFEGEEKEHICMPKECHEHEDLFERRIS